MFKTMARLLQSRAIITKNCQYLAFCVKTVLDVCVSDKSLI